MAQPDRQGAARPNPRRQHRPRRRREAIDAKVKAKLLRLFRDGVLVGLKDIPRDYNNTKQPEYRLPLKLPRFDGDLESGPSGSGGGHCYGYEEVSRGAARARGAFVPGDDSDADGRV